VKLKARYNYLLQCKRSNIVPKHLSKYGTDKLLFYNDYLSCRASFLSHRFARSILNLEISDNFKQRKNLVSNIYRLSRAIEKNLPIFYCNQFFATQHSSLSKLLARETSRLNNKLRWNRSKFHHVHNNTNTSNDTYLKNIKKIQYVCSNASPVSTNDYTISLVDSNHSNMDCHNNKFSVSVTFDPAEYAGDSRKLLFEPRDKWFINASNVLIPKEVIGLLQLGEGFCLPPVNRSDLFIQYIKNFENNFSRFRQQQSCINNLRFQLFNLLKPIHKLELSRSNIDLQILDSVSSTKSFIKDNPNVLFTRADKGHTVVALNRGEYLSKMKACLSDSDTYIVLKQNPAKKLFSDLKIMLKRWNNQGYVSSGSYFFLNSSNAVLPRAYGLPKIHKVGHPLRIIVSSSDSPLHNLAHFLHKILIKSLPSHFSHVKNSFQLKKLLSNLYVPDDCFLASFDVVSLFTNVPTDMALDIIKEKWPYIETHTNLPLNELIFSIKLVLDSTFFIFDNTIYKQTFGTPMGSPLSPVIADLILQRLESSVLNNYTYKPIFYYRYVDDIILAVPVTHLHILLDKFNAFHHRFKFTMEMSGEGDVLSFLDLTIIKKNNALIFDWFQKPTFSGRFLNFYSHHPFPHKKGTIYSLVDRVVQLSHPKFHKINFDHIIKILLDNGYPLDLIFTSIRRRLHTHRSKVHKETEKHSTPYFTIPYVSCIANKFIEYFKKITFCKLAFSCYNKLNRFIKVHKDALPITSQSNVVYQIHCLDCDATYVGQTKRSLHIRVSEHKNHLRRNSTQSSVITEHRLKYKHDFDWDGVKILDKETNYNKRLISEMIFIKKQIHGLNAQTDTALLDAIYNDLLQSSL